MMQPARAAPTSLPGWSPSDVMRKSNLISNRPPSREGGPAHELLRLHESGHEVGLSSSAPTNGRCSRRMSTRRGGNHTIHSVVCLVKQHWTIFHNVLYDRLKES